VNNRWKGLIVVVLAVAVFAVISGKRHAAQTPAASTSATSSCSASGCSVATPPATPAASSAPAEEGAKPVAQTKAAPAPAGAAVKKTVPTPAPKALPQMIELGSKTCSPCQMMQPILEELRKENKGQLEVPFWDVYDHPDKAKAYGIRVIPTQVFIGADGKEFFRHEGFFPKADILAKFTEHGVVLRGAK
jgi:thioredoxin 1